MRALVTGGAGFVGSTLVDRLLAAGHAVDVVDDLSTGSLANLADARADRNHQLKVHQVDLRSSAVVDLIARRTPEVVFHLAARPGADVHANVLGSVHVLDGVRAAGSRKLVYAASGDTLYGDPDPESLPVRESAPHAPTTLHGVSKKVVLDYLGAYRSLHGVGYAALALATVYGPRQRHGVVADALAGRPVPDGTLDLVYVDDVVDALVRAADRGTDVLCNIGTGIETSTFDLCAKLGVEPVLAPGPPRRVCLDPTRAAVHLGWRPWTDVDAGVSEVLRFREHDHDR